MKKLLIASCLLASVSLYGMQTLTLKELTRQCKDHYSHAEDEEILGDFASNVEATSHQTKALAKTFEDMGQKDVSAILKAGTTELLVAHNCTMALKKAITDDDETAYENNLKIVRSSLGAAIGYVKSAKIVKDGKSKTLRPAFAFETMFDDPNGVYHPECLD